MLVQDPDLTTTTTKMFKGLIKTLFKGLYLVVNNNFFKKVKILYVFKSQLLPISWAPQTWDFHLAEPTLPAKSP